MERISELECVLKKVTLTLTKAFTQTLSLTLTLAKGHPNPKQQERGIDVSTASWHGAIDHAENLVIMAERKLCRQRKLHAFRLATLKVTLTQVLTQCLTLTLTVTLPVMFMFLGPGRHIGTQSE
jgi:hypothetical protein